MAWYGRDNRYRDYEHLDGGDGGGGGRVMGGGGRLLVVVLGLTGVLGLAALTAHSLHPGPPSGDRLELVVTSGGGWGRLGKLPPPHTPDPKWDPEPSQSVLGEFNYAAVSVDSIPCAKIGK